MKVWKIEVDGVDSQQTFYRTGATSEEAIAKIGDFDGDISSIEKAQGIVLPGMFTHYDERTGAEVYDVPGLGLIDAYDLKEKGYEFVGFEQVNK
jgi:hypothetical protein